MSRTSGFRINAGAFSGMTNFFMPFRRHSRGACPRLGGERESSSSSAVIPAQAGIQPWILDIPPWRDKFLACHALRGWLLDIRSSKEGFYPDSKMAIRDNVNVVFWQEPGKQKGGIL